jgi:hypothetical protein
LQSASEGAQESSLAEAGNAFEQYMAGREQTNQDALYYIILSDNHLRDFAADRADAVNGRLEHGF